MLFRKNMEHIYTQKLNFLLLEKKQEEEESQLINNKILSWSKQAL